MKTINRPDGAVVQFARYGTADVLQTAHRAMPHPGPDQIAITVAAAGVNPADYALRSGRLRLLTLRRMPFVPGYDIAGTVTAAGSAVTGFQVGDAVTAMLPIATGGGYAAHAVVAADAAAPAPVGLPLGDAAAVPLAALTALQALRDRADLQPGADLLVYGASGGVGHFAVQIGVRLGARVTAVTSGRNADWVRHLGATAVVDYHRADPVVALGAHFDVVLDAVGKFPFRRSRRVLRPGGVAVTVVPFLDRLAPGWLAWTRGGRRLRSVMVTPSGSDLRAVNDWISAGHLRPYVEQRFPLTDAAAAHRLGEQGRVRGKLLLTVDEKLAATVVSPH